MGRRPRLSAEWSQCVFRATGEWRRSLTDNLSAARGLNLRHHQDEGRPRKLVKRMMTPEPRWIRSFALLPRRMTDGVVVWLQPYEWRWRRVMSGAPSAVTP